MAGLSMIQLCTAVLLVLLKSPPSTLGMVMTFILQITAIIDLVVQTRVMLEADIISLDRILQYADNPPEDDEGLNGCLPPANWATKDPLVKFSAFTAAHHVGGRPCLRDINLVFRPGQRVAVVGRTGAGKSSLALALQHGLDVDAVTGGHILIDGRDISLVKPSDLRRRMATVPQEPMLFTGTLRENLDPTGQGSEEELEYVFKRCNMDELFQLQGESTPLETVLHDGG